VSVIELRVEKLDELDTHLTASSETVRGPLSFSDPESKISVGRPTIVEIRPDQMPDPLPPGSVANRARFALLRLAISIRPATEEWLERVWVSVSLDSSLDSAPALWSMIPDHASSTVSVDDTLTLGASFKFLGVKREIKSSGEESLVSLTTFGLMESEGGWELSQISGKVLRGSYEFAAVIRADETAEIGGVARYEATVGRRRFGVISASCDVSDNGGARFSLEAPSAGGSPLD
jgi:hypothetical protein